MNEQEKLDKVLNLAMKVGKLYVAPDVYKLLRPRILKDNRLNGVVIEISRYMEPGTIVAVDNPPSLTELL